MKITPHYQSHLTNQSNSGCWYLVGYLYSNFNPFHFEIYKYLYIIAITCIYKSILKITFLNYLYNYKYFSEISK